MRRGCPLCEVALPQEIVQVCRRCGLTWAEVEPEGWASAPALPAPAATPGRPLLSAGRPAIGDIALYLLLVAPFGVAGFGVVWMMIAAVATDNVPYGPIGWLVLVIALPLAAAVGLFVLATGLSILWRVVFPATLTSDGDTLRVRVVSRWGLRTDVQLPRTELFGAALRPWQLGMREVWIRHRSGAAFRVAGPLLAEAAAPLMARIDTWIKAGAR